MMYLADTMSRAYLKSSSLSSPKIDFFDEVADIRIVEDLDVNEGKISEIKVATAQDKDLKLVMELVKSGWPQKRQGVRLAAHPFYTVKDELSIQDELLFKSERVVVPSSLQRKMLQLMQSTHLGIGGCIHRGRESFFWPGMNEQVNNYISKCPICLSFNRNSVESHWKHMMFQLVPGPKWLLTCLHAMSTTTSSLLIISHHFLRSTF